MKKIILYSWFAFALSACGDSKNGDANDSKSTKTDEAFNAFSERFVAALGKQHPEASTAAGFHGYDSLLTVHDEAQKAGELAFNKAWLDSLNSFKIDELSPAYQIDFHLIENRLQQSNWYANDLQQGTWDPSMYNVSDVFALMLNENYASLETKLQNFHKRLLKVPAYYRAAKNNIKNPVAELKQLGIDQNVGGISIFSADFKDSLSKANIAADVKTAMLAAADSAVWAIKDYAQWLKNLKSDNPRSFRLGENLYEQKFKYDIQSKFTAAEMYDMAVSRKTFLHQEMAKLSRQLWPKYFGSAAMPQDSLLLISKLIDTLSTNHTRPETFQSAIEQQIPLLIEFIKEKDLIYIDPAKPLVVRKEPAYMAGVAGASISAPGPYDKQGNTYYNVGSLEGWPTAKAESYLREYNDYILQILNIHEAIPGHYTQLVYANQSPSIIKSLFGNGAMIEGWAVYTEQMMLENGYGNNEPEMWLMWYKWHLRTVCNTILDYSVHVRNMERDAALNLLTKEAFQQQAEAEGKWTRVTVSSVQLTSYYSGYKEIYDLRESYKKKMGKDFNLKAFHEKFLSYGSAPVKYIRQMMME